MKILNFFILLSTLVTTINLYANCGPVPPGMKQDKNCNLVSNIPPSLGNDIVAEGSIESVVCDKSQIKSAIYRAILKVDRVKSGPNINKIDFIFEPPKGASVLTGDKGEFVLKRKKSEWFLVTKRGSVFSGGILPRCE